jgi:hypothetical protein
VRRALPSIMEPQRIVASSLQPQRIRSSPSWRPR